MRTMFFLAVLAATSQGFGQSQLLSIGGTAGVILSQTATILHVQAPPGPPVTVPVVVTTPNGCFATTSYTYQ